MSVTGRGTTPNTRVGDLSACDKRNGTCQREETKEEGGGKARRARDEEEEGKAGPPEIGWKTLPNSHARRQIQGTPQVTHSPYNGQAVQTPRAKVAQKSRFPKRTPPLPLNLSLFSQIFSGNKMPTYARLKSCADTTSRTERTTTSEEHPNNKPPLILSPSGITNCVARSALMPTVSPSFPLRTPSAQRWKANYCRNSTTSEFSTHRQNSAT